MARRTPALVFIDASNVLTSYGYDAGRNSILDTISDVFKRLSNHSALAIYIPGEANSEGLNWRLYKDILVYAEKFQCEHLESAYYKRKSVQQSTEEYVDGLRNVNIDWHNAYGGYVFRDCFVIKHNESQDYDLLLLMDKNVRDERLMRCPACGSSIVRGNSYPTLNVRSWECMNPLCPDRSKYGRGKRYSFLSLLRQHGMSLSENIIDKQSITDWRRDVVPFRSLKECFTMIQRHYSYARDEIEVYSLRDDAEEFFLPVSNRKIKIRTLNYDETQADVWKHFSESEYFTRFFQEKSTLDHADSALYTQIGKAIIAHGDAFDVLNDWQSESIDAAVTSPPYYNAKSYSHWSNIYCYIYDMYNIFRALYRVLRPGSPFLLNIFDYFDNENDIVFSAMGKKRLILGAYLIEAAMRAGFEVCGNIIWDKGNIEGSRNYNQGNLSPYYQIPFNCWEHVMILSRGRLSDQFANLRSCVKAIQPVLKIKGGQNTLGHSAPYPVDIPDLLVSLMFPDQTIVDPFLGSGTSCIAANAKHVNSLGIEVNSDYYDLSMRRIKGALTSMHSKQLSFI